MPEQIRKNRPLFLIALAGFLVFIFGIYLVAYLTGSPGGVGDRGAELADPAEQAAVAMGQDPNRR